MTREELRERQSWSLHQKIDHSLGVIDQFYSRLDGKVFVSFSGGKDSTVLLDLCRIIDPNVKAVFFNTGNEFPDIVKFVRKLKDDGYNIEIVRPNITPKEVIEKCGFPLLSKERSQIIDAMRNSPDSVKARRGRGEISNSWKSNRLPKKWEWLLSEAFYTTHKCCYYLKKKPSSQFAKRSGLYPILGTMACESQMRQSAYIKRGSCNSFSGKIESTPLAIWMEQDVYDYIKERNLPIADIYHKGATRTGCMFCGFGAHSKDDNRFDLVKSLHPKFYNLFMSYKNNGVSYIEALNKVMLTVGKEPLTLANIEKTNKE